MPVPLGRVDARLGGRARVRDTAKCVQHVRIAQPAVALVVVGCEIVRQCNLGLGEQLRLEQFVGESESRQRIVGLLRHHRAHG